MKRFGHGLFQKLMIIGFALSLLSCNQKSPKNDALVKIKNSNVIIDELDWVENPDGLSQKVQENFQSVGKVILPSIPDRCTGFLISQSLLLTNYHCVSSSRQAEGATLVLTNQEGEADEFLCETYEMGSKKLDFALLKCEGRPGHHYGYSEINSYIPRKGNGIYLLHHNCDHEMHPNCDPAPLMSPGRFNGLIHDYKILHTGDTLRGSSGAPIFSRRSHKVIGIHNKGRDESSGMEPTNFGVSILKIFDYIDHKRPDLDVKGEFDDLSLSFKEALSDYKNRPLKFQSQDL